MLEQRQIPPLQLVVLSRQGRRHGLGALVLCVEELVGEDGLGVELGLEAHHLSLGVAQGELEEGSGAGGLVLVRELGVGMGWGGV